MRLGENGISRVERQWRGNLSSRESEAERQSRGAPPNGNPCRSPASRIRNAPPQVTSVVASGGGRGTCAPESGSINPSDRPGGLT